MILLHSFRNLKVPAPSSAGAVFPRFANADDCHHAPGVAVRSAMGEEEIGVALRAAADDLNGLGLKAGREKLAAIGFDEIDVKAGADG